MKKILLLFFLHLFYLFPLYSINTYLIREIGIINFGEKKEELGYRKVGQGGIGSNLSTPKAFSINSINNLLYIIDPIKKRIVIYDLTLQYQKEIKGKGFSLKNSDEIKFGEGNEIYLLTGQNLFYTNDKGDLNYYFKYIYTYETIKSKGYYPLKGNVYFYDKDDKIKMINNTGEISSEIESEKALSNLYNNQINNSKSITILNNQDYTYFKENNILVDGNRVLTTNKYKAKKQYYDHVKAQVKQETRSELLSKGILKVNNFTSDFDVYDAMESFIGYDSDDNAYWNGWVEGTKRVVIVLNILGEAIDCFEIDQKFKQQIVAPNGDVYMWEIKPEGVTFYKITRHW